MKTLPCSLRFAVLAVCILTTSALSGGAPKATDVPAKGAWTPNAFVQRANICGQKEVAVARLAESRTTNGAVLSYAYRIKNDHERLNRELAGAAVASSLMRPDTNLFSSLPSASVSSKAKSSKASNRKGTGGAVTDSMGDDAALLDKARGQVALLGRLQGSAFDAAFARTMVADHVAAIALFDEASHTLEDPGLRSFAAKGLPVLQQHLAATEILLQRLELRLGFNR